MDTQSVDDVNNQYHHELLKNQEIEKPQENTFENDEISFNQETSDTIDEMKNSSNDLREFGVDTDEPDLFSSDSNSSDSSDLLSSSENENEEDDLEIPAFLRRQKN